MLPPFDIAADLDTPVSAYLKLRPFQPRFLLESVVGGDTVGRYSIIGFGECETLRVVSDAGDPMAKLREALARAPRPGRGHPGLPFTGGLVGFSSFEFVRKFEPSVPATTSPSGLPESVWVLPKSLLVFDHATRRCAVLHDGTTEEQASIRRDVVHALRGPVPPHGSRSFRSGGFGSPSATMSREEFVARVGDVKQRIRDGEVYQLVLSVAFEGACELEPFEVYRALRLLNPSPYMYFVDVDGTAVVGSSPEALVKLDGRTATLRPIAGTRPRGSNPEHDLQLEAELLADPKEAAEHVMLVDLARNDLGRVAVGGSVSVAPYRTIERYSHVMHIVSGVVGELAPQHDAFDLFAAAFPAGTVVGAPKVRALEYIDELEPSERGVYAGTVGYFGVREDPDGNEVAAMDQAIAIRTLTIRDGCYRYQAGAGIVADSDPEAEYREVLAKSAALRAALLLAEEGL